MTLGRFCFKFIFNVYMQPYAYDRPEDGEYEVEGVWDSTVYARESEGRVYSVSPTFRSCIAFLIEHVVRVGLTDIFFFILTFVIVLLLILIFVHLIDSLWFLLESVSGLILVQGTIGKIALYTIFLVVCAGRKISVTSSMFLIVVPVLKICFL